jgi:uncharacterized protein YbjQ (UPF0145 family)
MKKTGLLVILLLSITTHSVLARSTISEFPIKQAMSLEQAKEKVGNEVRFYFGNQKHGGVLKSWGEVSTNKKTNAFLKSDEEACNHVFLSALIALRNRAIKEGGNAVVKIKSNYKGKTTSSEATFQCGAGNVIAGVALKGTIVKLP